MNPGHQPERFQVFNYLPNQRAFTIKGTNYVFHIDRYGGWFDEYGNYYNENAEPGEPPSSSQSYSNDEDGRSKGSSDSDQFQKQFGRPGYVEDMPEEEANMLAVGKNLSQLQHYSKNSFVRIFFCNLGRHSSSQEIKNGYSQSVGKILNILIDKKRKDSGYFIVSDQKTAEKLIHLEGVKVIERPLYFSVEPFYNYLLHPISEDELIKSEKPKYVAKYQDLLPKESLKEIELEKTPITNSWAYYKFEKDIFPKKSSFKQWMQENGLVVDQDFKSVEKMESDPSYAKIEMTASTFKSINGLSYNGQKVQFFLLKP